jgi:hypothetical protein
MAIFYTDTGSLNRLEVTGSVLISGSGNSILAISGSSGSLLSVSDLTAGANIFQVTSASIDVFKINQSKGVHISGSLAVTGSTILSGALAVVGAITGPTIDALSNEISIVESVINNVSALAPGGAAQVGLQNAINALSNRISAIPGGATSVNPTRYVSVANTLTTATLTGISGLTTSVSAGVIYQIEGRIMYSVSAATGNSFGMVWPTANRVAGQWIGGISVSTTGASTFSTLAIGDFDTGDSNSVVWSAIVGAVGLHFIKVDGIIDAQTGGAIYPVARSSVATNTLVIARGSYFRVARIN